MLGHLQQTTRPDISFAVHQCARFSTNPKRSHEVAVKWIGRYLLGTKDEGIIFNPSNTLYLDCYVDADFAGMYKVEDSDDPISVNHELVTFLCLQDHRYYGAQNFNPRSHFLRQKRNTLLYPSQCVT